MKYWKTTSIDSVWDMVSNLGNLKIAVKREKLHFLSNEKAEFE